MWPCLEKGCKSKTVTSYCRAPTTSETQAKVLLDLVICLQRSDQISTPSAPPRYPWFPLHLVLFTSSTGMRTAVPLGTLLIKPSRTSIISGMQGVEVGLAATHRAGYIHLLGFVQNLVLTTVSQTDSADAAYLNNIWGCSLDSGSWQAIFKAPSCGGRSKCTFGGCWLCALHVGSKMIRVSLRFRQCGSCRSTTVFLPHMLWAYQHWAYHPVECLPTLYFDPNSGLMIESEF